MHNKLVNDHLPEKPYESGGLVPIRELHAGHREAILRHLLLLNKEDRHLRFGTQTSDAVIASYVEHLDFNRDAIFASFDTQLKIVGMAHLAYLPKLKDTGQAAEFGVSVLKLGRGRGIGSALLARAAMHARNTNIKTLFVHCLANNKAMMHLATKAGMRVEYAYGDADAYLTLPAAHSGTIIEEAANKQWGDFDYALKANFKRSRDAWWWPFKRPVTAI